MDSSLALRMTNKGVHWQRSDESIFSVQLRAWILRVAANELDGIGCRSLLAGDSWHRLSSLWVAGATGWNVRATSNHRLQAGSYKSPTAVHWLVPRMPRRLDMGLRMTERGTFSRDRLRVAWLGRKILDAGSAQCFANAPRGLHVLRGVAQKNGAGSGRWGAHLWKRCKPRERRAPSQGGSTKLQRTLKPQSSHSRPAP